MTNSSLYLRLIEGLARPAAAFEVRQLFLHRTGWDARSLAHETEEIGEADALWLLEMAARLGDGEPLQYLLGEWEFYGLPFKVGPGVLIPQPDTERVVDVALELLEGMTDPFVADLCAGSGAIGVAIAHNCPAATCWTVELSEAAMDYLQINIALNEVEGRVIPLLGDVTEPLALPPLDLIVSNPPYLSRAELLHVPPEVAAEPVMALDGGEDGLDFYRAITEGARRLLKPGGALLFEVGHTQAARVADMMAAAGYDSVGITEDYAGIPRCVWGFYGG